LIMTFTDCLVTFEDRMLFGPSWGVFDMAVGEKIVSAFSGPADPDAYGLDYEAPIEKTHKIKYSEHDKKLHGLYQKVRDLRDDGSDGEKLKTIFNNLKLNYPEDWLLPMEILEQIVSKGDSSFEVEIRDYLIKMKENNPNLSRLIDNGFKMLWPA